jgi:hypothetical protein
MTVASFNDAVKYIRAAETAKASKTSLTIDDGKKVLIFEGILGLSIDVSTTAPGVSLTVTAKYKADITHIMDDR